MAVVYIPALLQELTAGRSPVEAAGATVREVVSNLDRAFPGIAGRLVDEGRLRTNISVAVDGEVSPAGLLEPVQPDSEVHFVAAISGGAESRVLARVTKICMALPGADAEPYGSHVTFRVKKRVFAYYLDNHHGDGKVAIVCKVLKGDNEALIRSDPERFYMPAYIGPRGWVALRLDLGKIDWEEAGELVRHSHELVSPRPIRR